MVRKNNELWRTKESGAGLVEAIVFIALLAAGGVGLMNMSRNILGAYHFLEIEGIRNQVKKTLLISTDCRQLTPCQSNELKDIRDFDGKILIGATTQTKYGPWTIRAQCRPSQTVEVRVALLNAQNKPLKDPLRGKIIDWVSPSGLLIEEGLLCGKKPNATGATQATAVYGARCEASSGSCPHPSGSGVACCDDGRDGGKPSCPAGMKETFSYWDRQGDWGGEGQWMVLCQ